MNEEALWAELGEQGMGKLVASFYQEVRQDKIIGPMYPDDDWEGSEDRLYKFLCFRFGNDPRYQQERGHPRLRGRHLPFKIGVRERDRWLDLMNRAMGKQEMSDDAKATLFAFFSQVADFMRNQSEDQGPSSTAGGRGVDFRIR